ncbi:MAG: RNA polymerase sigma factor [Bacteroidia bacterium]
MDEKALIKACANGDSKAHRVIYDQYGQQLMGLCMRYTGNREDAEEIFHDSLIKVFKNIANFKNESSLKTWISRIGINTALDFLRKRKKTLFLSHISDYNHEIVDSDIPPEVSFEAETAMKMLKTMPVNQQVIINLFIIEEMSHKEIAAQLGISEEASRVQLSRAKRVLSNIINTKATENRRFDNTAN